MTMADAKARALSAEQIASLDDAGVSPRPSFWRRFIRNRRAVAGAALLAIFIAVALFAPHIAPFEADEQNIVDRLRAPDSHYLMGTDQLGRDIFSRAVFATQVSMPIGVFAMIVAVTVGVSIGMASGYFGGSPTMSSCA